METDERYEVNSNGELVIGRPVTLTSKERKELIEKLFSINGWNYTLEKEISQSHFLIKLSNKNLNVENYFHLYHGNIRKEDPNRNREEKKIQLGTENDPRQYMENAIILGFYDIEKKDIISDTVITAWPIEEKKNYPANPSLRVNMRTDIQVAKNTGYYEDKTTGKNIVTFRPEFIYHYIENYKRIHYSNEHYSVSTNLNELTNKKEKLIESKNIIYYGIPGCGKSYYIENTVLKDVDKIHDVFRTTFYLDYSNNDFIGQIYPVVKDDGCVSYEEKPGPFTKALEQALRNPDKTIYLIIEEINRGNAAAIFGDIFQLLDRLKDDRDGRVKGDSEYPVNNEFIEGYFKKNNVPLQGDKIYIPHNLTLLATMNTSDQNVFPLDTAFKRRWDREKVMTDWNDVGDIKGMYIPYTNITWEKFAITINSKMLEDNYDSDVSVSEDKQMGAYFVKENMLSKDEFGGDEDTLKAFINNVLDYLYNDVTKFNHELLFDKNVKTYDGIYETMSDCVHSLNNSVDDSNIGVGKKMFEDVFADNVNKELFDQGDNDEQETQN